MNRETFVRIINALKEQKQREEKFSKAMVQAFVDAGECGDFYHESSFNPPTNVMIDQILQALSYSFVNENQTQEATYDHINYYFYELEIMNYMFLESVDSRAGSFEARMVPAYYHSKDGTKLPLVTPEDLYDSLVYEMVHPTNTPSTKEPDHEVPESVSKSEFIYKPEFLDILTEVRRIISDHLGIPEDIQDILNDDTDISNDLGKYSADSLDDVEILMELEQQFNISIPSHEFDTILSKPTPLSMSFFVAQKLGYIKEVS